MKKVVIFDKRGNEVTYLVPNDKVYVRPSEGEVLKRKGVYGSHGTLAILDSLKKLRKTVYNKSQL